ncbi:hypothetical protein ZHAS_00005867 [Anopheles sinensis]|uniref:Uncharacterized protein n=1 Tax=Anopheles sinensis TaxID=74873 RepID=A0A084VKH1_ANOSI|nr:hypothetical protein ZHAS_00005867 [Anopheles sinensis]
MDRVWKTTAKTRTNKNNSRRKTSTGNGKKSYSTGRPESHPPGLSECLWKDLCGSLPYNFSATMASDDTSS